MAITVDWTTKTFFIPQADLTLISGTLYEMDTDTYFRAGVNALMASAPGMAFEDAISHNTEVTITGLNLARVIEVVNGFNVTFTPDSQYTVSLVGSNNNIFDVQNGILNQNQVQVIPNNSAGLIALPNIRSMLEDNWQLLGNDLANAVVRVKTSGTTETISVGGKTYTVVESPTDTITLTRTA